MFYGECRIDLAGTIAPHSPCRRSAPRHGSGGSAAAEGLTSAGGRNRARMSAEPDIMYVGAEYRYSAEIRKRAEYIGGVGAYPVLPMRVRGGVVFSQRTSKLCPRRGCSSMVEQKPSKLMTRVRFPSPAPIYSST
jgi:hypothetical protein